MTSLLLFIRRLLSCSGINAPVPRQSEKLGSIMTLSEQRLLALLLAEILREGADGRILKKINDRKLSLQGFLQSAMSPNYLYGPATKVKEILIESYPLNL